MDTFLNIDWNILLFLNGTHNHFLDSFFIIITNKFTWIPLYILIAFLFYKTLGLKNTLFVILFALICFTLTDQISYRFFKPLFERLRPCHTQYGQEHLWLPAGCGGLHGFVSSHAANTMGLAFYCILIFLKNTRMRFKGVIGFILISYAILNMLSRVYLGAHYPSDVICGAILGMIIAWICYFFASRITSKNIQQPTS